MGELFEGYVRTGSLHKPWGAVDLDGDAIPTVFDVRIFVCMYVCMSPVNLHSHACMCVCVYVCVLLIFIPTVCDDSTQRVERIIFTTHC